MTGLAALQQPTVSLVIPAYNEQERIERCLTAAVSQTVPLHEIIVVDNRSTDRTAAIVRTFADAHPRVRIRLLPQFAQQGLIPTRNAGFDAATGDVLGRIDADSVLTPTWCENVRRVFADPAIAAATGPVSYYDMPFERLGLRGDHRVRKLLMRLNHDFRFVFGSNMAIRHSAWRVLRSQVCPDRADMLHEDIDISIHLADNDYRVAYAPDMVCGISARRMDNSLRDYSSYVQRFRRTYQSHNLRTSLGRPAMVLLYSIYPTLHMLRQVLRLRRRTVQETQAIGRAIGLTGMSRTRIPR